MLMKLTTDRIGQRIRLGFIFQVILYISLLLTLVTSFSNSMKTLYLQKNVLESTQEPPANKFEILL